MQQFSKWAEVNKYGRLDCLFMISLPGDYVHTTYLQEHAAGAPGLHVHSGDPACAACAACVRLQEDSAAREAVDRVARTVQRVGTVKVRAWGRRKMAVDIVDGSLGAASDVCCNLDI